MSLAALLAGGCGGGGGGGSRPVDVAVPPAPVPDAAAIARPRGLPTPGDSAARNLADYKVEVANRLYQGNAAQVFSGTPPHNLRSVVVLSVTLDAAGAVKSVAVFRDNGDDETRNAAVASVHRAAPYPRPARGILRSGQVQFTESWLFRDDARFQLRTLAEAYQQ